MRKRLFTLLLTAALVLSMGTAQVTAGDMSGTEQTEQGADVSVQTPDEADAVGDDAPAGEPGEDDGAANESGGDDGEAVPAADNSMPFNDEPQTTADEPAAVSVLFEGAEHIISLTAEGADVLSDVRAGTPIVLSADSEGRVTLGMELEDGYTAGTDENSSDSVSFDGGMIEIRDDGDGSAVVQITARPQVMAIDASGSTVKITLVDADGYVTGVTDSNHNYDSSLDGSLSGSYELKQGDKLFLRGKACALDVEGGHVTEKYYSLNGATGELSVTYFVEPDGSEDMTITTRADDKAPKPITIEYEDPENKIKERDNYVLPGGSFIANPDEGYTISVEGSVSSVTTYRNVNDKECYMVQVNEDATSVTVTVMAAKAGAKLSATIPDAVESTGLYGMSEILEREYVGHNGTMENGKGWFLLKNGYAVGSGVTGGSVWIYSIGSDEMTGSIHTCYTVDATADTVNVPIVEAQPYRWVNVKVDNDVGCRCTFSNVLPGGGTNSSSSEDTEYRWVVLDELTATLGGSGELEAVSGCTLRWVKGTDGKITYHIIPDEDGDTSVELRVIQAANQKPVLKAGTDVETGVQPDDETKSKLMAAIDEFARGNVPVGMSSETAGELKAALEAADAVTVPELSAVLRVKRGGIQRPFRARLPSMRSGSSSA